MVFNFTDFSVTACQQVGDPNPWNSDIIKEFVYVDDGSRMLKKVLPKVTTHLTA